MIVADFIAHSTLGVTGAAAARHFITALHVFYTIICNENYLTSIETVSDHDLGY